MVRLKIWNINKVWLWLFRSNW